MKWHPTFVRAPPFSIMVETRSDWRFYIYHRTRGAKACAKSYDKWMNPSVLYRQTTGEM